MSLKIITFDFLEVEISFQAMVQPLLVTKQMICNLYNRVVVPEAEGIMVAGELFGYVDLLIMFEIEYKKALDE